MFKKIFKILILFCVIKNAYAAREVNGYNGGIKNESMSEVINLLENKQYDKTIKLLLIEKKKNKLNADLYNYLGYAYRKKGDFDLSIKNYKKALKINPKHLRSHNYIGMAYLSKGQIEKSKIHLKELEELCKGKCNEFINLKNAIASSLKNEKK